MCPMYVNLNKMTLKVKPGTWLYGVHRTCTSAAAVWHSISHLTPKQCCNHFGTLTHSELHETRVQWVCLETENSSIYSCHCIALTDLGLILTQDIIISSMYHCMWNIMKSSFCMILFMYEMEKAYTWKMSQYKMASFS